MSLVLDACMAVEVLLRTPLGRRVSPRLAGEDLAAPELLDAEVLAALRKIWLHGQIEEQRAREALEDLAVWPIERIPNRVLLPLAWQYRHNLSGYDAFYVAAAHLAGAAVLTADGPLARAPSTGVAIENVRL